MLLLGNRKRTPRLMGRPLLSSAAFSLRCACVGMMSFKPSPSKCSPLRIEELSLKDFLLPTFLPSFSDLILPTTLAKRNGCVRSDEQTCLAASSPECHLFPFFIPSSCIYKKKTKPVDWLEHPTAGQQQRSLCKRNCCVGLTGSMMASIKSSSSGWNTSFNAGCLPRIRTLTIRRLGSSGKEQIIARLFNRQMSTVMFYS